MAVIGSLNVELRLDNGEFVSALRDAQRSIASFAGQVQDQLVSIQRSVRNFGAAMTVGVTAPLALFGRAAVRTASDAVELQSAFNQTFKSMAGMMNEWAVATGNAMGRSTQEMQRGAQSFAIFFNQAARTRGEAALMSQQFAILAQDLSSFFNTSPEDAMTALAAALRGEADPIERYGVLVNDAALQQEMLSRGMRGTTANLTAQEKILLRYQVIMRSTRDAQGDVLRTSSGLANQLRSLNAAWEEMKVRVGEVLMPLVQRVVGALRGMIQWFTNLHPAVIKAIVVIGALAAAMGPLTVVMATIVGPAMLALFVARLGMLGRVAAWVIAPVVMFVRALGTLMARLVTGRALFPGIAAGLTRLGEIFPRIAGFLAPLAARIGAIRVAFTALGGPIGWAVTAIMLFARDIGAALGRVWRYAQETLGPPLQQLFTKLGDLFSTVVNGPIGTAIGAFIGFLGQLRDVIGSVLGTLLEGTLRNLVDLIAGVVGIVSSMVGAISALLRGDFAGAWREAGGVVDTFFQTIVNVIGGILPPIREPLQAIYDIARAVFIDGLGAVAEVVGAICSQIVSFFESMVSGINNALGGIPGLLWNLLGMALERARSWVRSSITAIVMMWQWMRGQLGLNAADAGRSVLSGFPQRGQGGAAAPADQAIPQPPAAPRGGGGGRGRGGGGGGRTGPSAEELAERREELRLQRLLEEARAREDHDAIRSLERQMERNRLVKQYRDLNMSAQDAAVAADRDMAALAQAETEGRERNLAISDQEHEIELARIMNAQVTLRHLEDDRFLREETVRLQREGLSLQDAMNKAQERSQSIQQARMVMWEREAELRQRSHELELAELRGDTALARRLRRDQDIHQRADDIYSGGNISREEAMARATREVDALREAGMVGAFRDTFREGVMAALNGDFGDWFNRWWTDQLSRSLEDALNSVADMLRDLLRSAFQGMGGGGEKGGILGTILSGVGMLFSGNGALSPKSSSGQVYATGIKGFARGGSLHIGGYGGVDRNLLSLNGSPIARVSRGERLDISPANDGGRSRVEIVPSPYFDAVVDGRAARVATPMAGAAAMGGSAQAQRAIAQRSARQIP